MQIPLFGLNLGCCRFVIAVVEVKLTNGPEDPSSRSRAVFF